MEQALIIITAIVIGVGMTYVKHRQNKKKIAELTRLTQQRGWTYTERDDSLADRFVGEPFGKGFDRQAWHILRGNHRGREVLAFEYVYHEHRGGGDKRHTVTYRNLVASLRTPAPRPTLELSRKGFGRRLLGIVGVRDLRLESEEFNKAFLIRTENDRFAYDVLHPRMMEWMLSDARAGRLPFRYAWGDLLTWEEGPLDAGRAMFMLEYLCDIIDQVPAFVWKD
ncbi:MAG: hypothetical protein ACRDQ5_05490 [Sciscionella sp.]